MALYHLIYSSIPSRELSDKELEDLLEVSRSANKNHGITGLLICLRDMYVQLIEGEEAEIKQLYKNLLLDARHYRVQTLREGEITKRFFPDWSMGFEKKNIEPELKESLFESLAEKSVMLFSILDTGITTKQHL